MTNFKLPEPARLEVRNGRESRYYSQDQLLQILADFGNNIAEKFSSPYSDNEMVIKHIVKELLA